MRYYSSPVYTVFDKVPELDKLLVIYGLSAGGAERVAVTLANGWAAHGEHVGIVKLSSQPSHYPLSPDVELITLAEAQKSAHWASALRNNLTRVYKLRSIIRSREPTWVIGVATSMNVLCILASLGTRSRVIATEHTHPPVHQLKSAWIMARKILYRLTDQVIAPTRLTADWLTKHTWTRSSVAIPNPIEYPLTRSEPLVDPGNHLEDNINLLLAVGRLDYNKGFDLLLAAFIAVHEACPDWRLVILGDGELRTELESEVSQRGLTDRVILPGVVGNVSDWYERAELFVLSSRYEGFGYVLAEAMAHGCACVSFDCDAGPRTILDSGKTGVLVPPEDTTALAAALNELMGDSERRATLGKAAKKSAERFSKETILAMWDSIFHNTRER